MILKYFASGDGPFYYSEQMRALSWAPPIWEAFKGFGENLLPRLWIDYPFRLVVKILFQLGLSWWLIEKLLWVGALSVAVFAIYSLARKFFTRAPSVIASIVYVFNTYTLLLFGGGQLGIFLAYSLAPLVMLRFIESIDEALQMMKRSKSSAWARYIKNGLFCALLVMFDLRIAYLTFGAIAFYIIVKMIKMSIAGSSVRRGIWSVVHMTSVAAVVTALVHAFWIFPMILAGGGISGLSEEFTGVGILTFLSVADFSHALSFIHPNWPENLFGKVYFLQPEFLVLPILAFSALLFTKQTKNKQAITYFALLALFGSFLAKGVNPPFGEIYAWLYTHVPGFVMFRDPTKFYVYISLGFSILIAHTVHQIDAKIYKYRLSFVIFIVFWAFTLRPLFLGQLTGNFRTVAIPAEYIILKDILIKDQKPSRTLWLPAIEKFAYASDMHPALSGDTLFRHASSGAMISSIATSEFQTSLYNAGIKYVIVPADFNRRMFLTDYAYDSRLREQYIIAIANAGLTRDTRFGDIAVFSNPSYRFEAVKPMIVDKQEYWSCVGVVISVSSLCAIGIYIKRKKNTI